MIVIRATVPAKPGQWEAAKAAAAGLRIDAQTRPGVIAYDFATDDEHETLIANEVYTDPDALVGHIRNADFTAFGAAVEVTRIEVYGKLTSEAESLVSAWGPITALPWL